MNEFGSMSARRNSNKIWSCERKVRYGVRCTPLLLNCKRARIMGSTPMACFLTEYETGIFSLILFISGGDMGFLRNQVYAV